MSKRKFNIEKRTAGDGAVTYMARVRVAGFAPATKTFGDPLSARRWADETKGALLAQREASTLRPDATKLTVADWLSEYLKDARVCRLASYGQIAQRCAWFSDEYGRVKLMHFGKRHVLAARDVLVKRGLAVGSVNRYMTILHGAWNWGQGAELILEARKWPTSKQLRFTEEDRVRFATNAELAALLKASDDAVMRTAIITAVGTGLRQMELLRLSWADVDLDAQTVTVHKAKNKTRRTVYLPANVVTALRSLYTLKVNLRHVWVCQRTGQPLTIGQLTNRWERLRAKAGIRDLRWHDLRHTTASYLAQAGASLPMIGMVLGHRNASSTQRYVHLLQGQPVTGHDVLNARLNFAEVLDQQLTTVK
jgi:integrase